MGICPKCKKFKQLCRFHKSEKSKNYIRKECWVCHLKHCEVCKNNKRKIEKRWYQNNKELRSQKAKEYRVKNKIEVRKRDKERRRKNKKKGWVTNTIGSHRRSGFTVKIDFNYLVNFIRELKNCPICNKKLHWGPKKHGKLKNNSPTLDRINNSLVLTKHNTMVICHRCNRSKGNRTLKEFINYCILVVKNKQTLLKY